MRSLILLILGVSAASAGGYYYRDDIPTQYRFWESARTVELKNQVIEHLTLPVIEIAALEPLVSSAAQVPGKSDPQELQTAFATVVDDPLVDQLLVHELIEEVEKDARAYVYDLSLPQSESVRVKSADHFVSANQVLELLNDDDFVEFAAPLSSKPIVQALAPRNRSLISRLEPDTENAGTRTLTLINTSVKSDLRPMFTVDSEQQNADDPVMIQRHPKAGESAESGKLYAASQNSSDSAVLEQSRRPAPKITIADLLRDKAPPAKENSVYYVRTVKGDDKQGIWGIIVDGLTENFADGIAISRGENIDTYQVNIPRQSDAMLPDNSSSFLGKLVDRKTRESVVYNFVEKKIGHNPDLIFPGQELLIINFEAQELIDIYTYFVENS